jgi:hypothetical protein
MDWYSSQADSKNMHFRFKVALPKSSINIFKQVSNMKIGFYTSSGKAAIFSRREKK